MGTNMNAFVELSIQIVKDIIFHHFIINQKYTKLPITYTDRTLENFKDRSIDN